MTHIAYIWPYTWWL